ncbi:MAG: hypothetical protein FJ213_11855, partial [Ignavibacteria bacterium]|nr:hypothetical protein [Ignavibacteria bacterium]
MKTLFFSLLGLLIVNSSFSQPRISFSDVMIKTELNPKLIHTAKLEARGQNLPISIYIPNTAFIEAKYLENGKIVYSVITNFRYPEVGGYTAFFDEVTSKFDLSKARIVYYGGKTIDNSGERIKISNRSIPSKLLLVTDWTYDRVMAFDYETGDLVDTAFIHSDGPRLQSPKQALQKSTSKIYVSDQISDVVQEYDTSGYFVKTFAPAGGVNNAILDNLRGITFRPNGNLLVCNASGTSQNTVQQFDTGGVFVNTFMSASVNSPFCVLYRQNDILLTNSSGTPKMFKYNFDGSLIGAFTSTTLNFMQQMIKNTDGTIIACDFSTPNSGLKVFDSTGTLITTLSGVTGNRGVFRLPSGNYLTTNGAGLHEIDDTTGALVRTIYSASSLQYINLFDFTPSGSVNASVNLNEGWNLFSIPILTSDMSVNTLLPNKTSSVYKYANAYSSVDFCENGAGYWVKYGSSATLNLSGSAVTNRSINVANGWNIVGPFEGNVNVSSITTTPPNIIAGQFYGYNNGYVTATELKPGKGYWIKVSQSGTLNLPTLTSKNAEFEMRSAELEKFSKLIVKDSDGNETTLYLTKDEICGSRYELPPIPPSGVFDARFSSDRLVENIINGSKELSISTLAYPVKIKVEGTQIRVKDIVSGKIIDAMLNDGEEVIIENNKLNKFSIESIELPAKFELMQNYPNPFNPSTT